MGVLVFWFIPETAWIGLVFVILMTGLGSARIFGDQGLVESLLAKGMMVPAVVALLLYFTLLTGVSGTGAFWSMWILAVFLHRRWPAVGRSWQDPDFLSLTCPADSGVSKLGDSVCSPLAAQTPGGRNRVILSAGQREGRLRGV